MTAQVGDLLILRRKRMEMAFSPPIPEDEPRLTLRASTAYSVPIDASIQS